MTARALVDTPVTDNADCVELVLPIILTAEPAEPETLNADSVEFDDPLIITAFPDEDAADTSNTGTVDPVDPSIDTTELVPLELPIIDSARFDEFNASILTIGFVEVVSVLEIDSAEPEDAVILTADCVELLLPVTEIPGPDEEMTSNADCVDPVPPVTKIA